MLARLRYSSRSVENSPPSPQVGQLLGRHDARAVDVAQAADVAPLVDRAHGVRRVGDHDQVVLAGDGMQRVVVGRQAVQIDRQDGARARRDRLFDSRRIEVEGPRVDVDEDRNGQVMQDGRGGGQEGQRRDDDLVARLAAGRGDGGVQRGRARAERQGVLRPDEGGILLLERLDLRVMDADELAALEHALHGRQVLGRDDRPGILQRPITGEDRRPTEQGELAHLLLPQPFAAAPAVEAVIAEAWRRSRCSRR